MKFEGHGQIIINILFWCIFIKTMKEMHGYLPQGKKEALYQLGSPTPETCYIIANCLSKKEKLISYCKEQDYIRKLSN